jgi:hypothetical protein
MPHSPNRTDNDGSVARQPTRTCPTTRDRFGAVGYPEGAAMGYGQLTPVELSGSLGMTVFVRSDGDDLRGLAGFDLAGA